MTINCGGWDKRWIDRGRIGEANRRSSAPPPVRQRQVRTHAPTTKPREGAGTETDTGSTFVQQQLAATDVRPPVTLRNWAQEVVWFNLVVVIATPLASVYGLYTTPMGARTAAFCVLYYLFNMIGA